MSMFDLEKRLADHDQRITHLENLARETGTIEAKSEIAAESQVIVSRERIPSSA